MARTIGRREFLRSSAGAGLGLVLGGTFAASAAAAKASVVSVGIGEDGAATTKAVGLLGGMKKFVPKGARVALLPNVQSRHPGSFTKPEILRA
ncbi:MAG TPA: hypothetical protein VLJ16_05645, partial [Acidobacteriota bacterium]|nr:hypothetical protein [Acidobacteriota bacterium]